MSVREHQYLYRISLLLCLLVLFVTACNTSGNSQTKQWQKAPASKQVYTAPLVGITDITTLDPALVLASDTPSMDAIQMLYTGLVQLNDKLEVQAQMARSWSISSDGLSYTFHLRPNLKFSDGTPLTSADVVYSINRALLPATKSPTAPIYLDLVKDSDKLLGGFIPTLIGDSLLAPDSHTVTIELKRPAAYFLSMLTYPCAYVVEKHLIDTYAANFTDHLNEGGSSGPFKVSQYIHGQEIDFVPNTDYYNPLPQLHKVVFSFYQQPDNAYHDYMTGRLDTTGVPVSIFATDKKRADFHQLPLLWINYYAMNYLTKPFDNIHIRQAFALAIDKTAIARNVWKGTVIPTNHIVPQGMPGYNTQLTGPDGTRNLTGNMTKARALLQQGIHEEGWSSITQIPAIKLTYATGVVNSDSEVNELIQMWQTVLGITVTANPIDYSTLLSQVTQATNNPNGLQMWGLAWVGEYPDLQDWLTRQFDRGVPNNNMNYGENTSNDAAQQQALQQQLEAADSNIHAATRSQTYQRAEQQLVNDVAWLPIEQVTMPFLRQPGVFGMVDNAEGLVPPDDWAHIYIAQYV